MRIYILEELVSEETVFTDAVWATCEVFSTQEKAEQYWDSLIDECEDDDEAINCEYNHRIQTYIVK